MIKYALDDGGGASGCDVLRFFSLGRADATRVVVSLGIPSIQAIIESVYGMPKLARRNLNTHATGNDSDIDVDDARRNCSGVQDHCIPLPGR